jgi:hypothetical protein
VRMPVALARPIARWQLHEIDPEIRQPAGVAQPLPYAFGTGRVKLRRIAPYLCVPARRRCRSWAWAAFLLISGPA